MISGMMLESHQRTGTKLKRKCKKKDKVQPSRHGGEWRVACAGGGVGDVGKGGSTHV